LEKKEMKKSQAGQALTSVRVRKKQNKKKKSQWGVGEWLISIVLTVCCFPSLDCWKWITLLTHEYHTPTIVIYYFFTFVENTLVAKNDGLKRPTV
jgi:hypothetical protein